MAGVSATTLLPTVSITEKVRETLRDIWDLASRGISTTRFSLNVYNEIGKKVKYLQPISDALIGIELISIFVSMKDAVSYCQDSFAAYRVGDKIGTVFRSFDSFLSVGDAADSTLMFGSMIGRFTAIASLQFLSTVSTYVGIATGAIEIGVSIFKTIEISKLIGRVKAIGSSEDSAQIFNFFERTFEGKNAPDGKAELKALRAKKMSVLTRTTNTEIALKVKAVYKSVKNNKVDVVEAKRVIKAVDTYTHRKTIVNALKMALTSFSIISLSLFLLPVPPVIPVALLAVLGLLKLILVIYEKFFMMRGIET
jgi:hypothetical protein